MSKHQRIPFGPQRAKKSNHFPSHGAVSRRARRPQYSSNNVRAPFAPPEDWHEPTNRTEGYKFVIQSPGDGYCHVVTPQQVADRLADVPEAFLEGLEVVQFSRMTRKKQSFPCYGMQWGATLYLYPIEESLEEWFTIPPRPEVYNEARMYGGRWDQPAPGSWRLRWTLPAIEDFYLNNILIHELGHLVDDRNTGYAERERFAEWFAVHYGYRASGGRLSRGRQRIRRRHHAK
jgi:hypothetical protein